MAIEVGSVQVAVVPSAQGFTEKLRAQINGTSAIGDDIGKSIGDRAAAKISDGITKGVETGGRNARIAAAKEGADSGGAFADSFKAKVDAALKSLASIKVGADTSEADLQLAGLRTELEGLGNLRIGVDITDAEAVAKLDELRARLENVGAKSPSVQVRVDVAKASAELAAFQAELSKIDGEKATAKVEVDAGGGAAGAESASAGMGDLVGKMTAYIGLAPALIPVGAAAVGALSGIAAAALAGAAGIGVLALAISGVTKAVGLLGQEQQAQASAAASAATRAASQAAAEASAANQLVGAQAALKSARESAANAAISSAEQVKNAEQSVADAERNQQQQSIASAQAVANARQSLADAERTQAQQQVQSAESIANAQENLANVEQSVAVARQSAARQVEQAERSLTEANRTAADAQKSLNDAREQAVRDLEDAANRQKDADLSAQQAALDLQTVQKTATQVLADSNATDQQKKQATLSLAEAQQRLAEAQQNAQRATEDNSKAQAGGINGDKGVVSAQQALLNATQQQTDAQQALADAVEAQQRQEIAGAQQIADAQRSLADARRSAAQQAVTAAEAVQKAQQGVANALNAQAQQAISSAEAVKRAEQSLADARRSQAQQAVTSAESIASAQRGVAQAMDAVNKAAHPAAAQDTQLKSIQDQLAALGPATVAFAKYWRDNISPLFSGLQNAAAGAILPGFKNFVTDITPLLPGLTTFIKNVGGAISDLFSNAGKALTSPFWKQFFSFLDSFTGPALTTLGDTLGYIAEGFAGLFQALAPVATQFGGIVLGWAKQFADWAMNLSNNTGFQKFLGYIVDNMPAVLGFIGSLIGVAGKLIDALAPLGSLVFTGLNDLFTWLSKLSPDQLLLIAGAVGLIAAALGAPVVGLAVAGVAAAGAMADLYGKSKTVHDFVTDKMIPVFKGIWHDAWDGIKSAIKSVTDAVDKHRQQFAVFADFITTKILPLLGPILKGAFTFLGDTIGGAISITGDLIQGWEDLFGAIKKVLDWMTKTLGPVMSGVWRDIKKAAATFVNDLGSIWGGITSLFAKPIKFVIDTVLNDGLLKAWNWVVDHIGMKALEVPMISVNLDPKGSSTGGGTNYAGATGYATGGVLPGYAPGRDSVMAMLSPGEGVLRPEVVRALGADTIHGWNRAAMSGGMPHFAGGGILGGIGGVASDIWGGVKGAASAAWGAARDVADLLKDPLKWLTSHLTAPLNALSSIDGNSFGKMVAGVPRALGSDLLDKLKGFVGIGGGSASAPGGGAMAYAGVVRQVLGMLGLNLADTNGVLSLIDHESSGNPTNVNRWDSNWTAGHPSVGLMQVIRGTFDSYAGPFRNTGPFMYGVSTDPLANIYAGVNYALHRYGEGMLAAGGRHNAAGDYIGYDNGGMLQPGHTLVYNGTGAPEPVFTGKQWQDIKSHGVGGGGLTDDDRALLRSVVGLADRPVTVQVGEREIATSVRDYWDERVSHGDKAWSR